MMVRLTEPIHSKCIHTRVYARRTSGDFSYYNKLNFFGNPNFSKPVFPYALFYFHHFEKN